MIRTHPVRSLVTAMVLCGLAHAAQPAQPAAAAEPIRVACVGDSITFGAGIRDRQHNSYPAQLGGMLGDGYDVRNFGVNGATMLKKGNKPYWKLGAFKAAREFQPNIVVIKLGTNDTKPNNWAHADELEADYTEMVRAFRSLDSKPTVLVCYPVPVVGEQWGINDKAVREGVIPAVDKVARATGATVIDLYQPLKGKPQLLPDKVHPNVEGAKIIATTVRAAVLAARGAKEQPMQHGLVGLRPLPRDERDHKHNHGGSWAGTPTYAEQKGKYPFVAEHLDTVMGWLDGDFKTRRMFFEFYWGLGGDRDDLDPAKNLLIKTIRGWEEKGGQIEHILLCREYRLAVGRGHKDAKPGPFKEDTRILYAEDIDQIRKLFTQAHAQKLVQHDNYKIIMMVEHPSFFADDPRVHPIVDKVEGIAYECHQFNRHWPLETGWSKPAPVIRGAKWTLDRGKEYIFYFGPIIWKSPQYHEFIERDWLETYWKQGLPKHHPKMHYYLNLFPHAHGRGRPVGPETDPHSNLGFTKWLIKEIKPETATE